MPFKHRSTPQKPSISMVSRTCCLKTPSVSRHPNVGPGDFGKDQVQISLKEILPPLPEKLPYLKLTAKAPENGWLESWKMSFFLGLKVYFQGRTVSFREGNNPQKLMSFPSLESFSKSEFSGSKC